MRIFSIGSGSPFAWYCYRNNYCGCWNTFNWYNGNFM